MRFDPDTMKVRICKKCKGLGFFFDLKGNRFVCAECGGTGRIIERNIVSEFPMNCLDDFTDARALLMEGGNGD